MSTTEQNLDAAFAGESQANRRYLFFADKADEEGQPQVARLFRAAAESETVHARNHFNVMNGVGSTSDNLKAAISGEHHEFITMYPGFIAQAKKEGLPAAETTFSHANEVEKIHHGLFQKALNDTALGSAPQEKSYFVCQVCGNTVLGEAPDKCPICGTLKSGFKEVK